ncbi:porin family protein [Flavobacterium aquicola]|uniref:Outer membrane protein with beta-barrel domain n=1 Tax=Flavobacterium aquicola TaxID=1682742 RepID=A0A3E0DXR5_9FLAO|nr:outer membrane beta-barrel protein [Flavobacterium aquicola]REG90751.1 hypothetical protein C8P67_11923 [Flavobacterium aquicola]
MKRLFLLFTTLLTMSCYSQISFEKGYFIDNSEQKIECFIKNNDWAGDPTDFKYRLSENEDIKTNGIESVKEFGIYGASKFIRETVDIEISNENINDMSNDMNPKFKQTQLFLKVLIEGKANLYTAGNPAKYFYNVDNSKIEQLVLKSYKNSLNEIVQNNLFRKQLFDNLKCSSIDIKNLLKLNYNKNSLVNLFNEYNKCSNSNSINYTSTKQRDVFNLTLRPHLNISSLTVNRNETKFYDNDFGNQMTFGFGIETEFILPFNKNKWSVILEPTYQNYDVLSTIDTDKYPDRAFKAEVTYKNLEIPLGIRHYFFLNNNSKIFINASFMYSVAFNSQIQYKFGDMNASDPLTISNAGNMAFGIGYKLQNKYSIEMRYNTARNILSKYIFWDSNYKTASIILGYTLF